MPMINNGLNLLTNTDLFSFEELVLNWSQEFFSMLDQYL